MTSTDQIQPDAEVTPVPVTVHSLSAEAAGALGSSPRPRRRRIRTRFDTVVVDPSNPVRPLLPDAPNRIRAVIQPHPPIGQANNNTSFGWIADTEAHATTAAREEIDGAYISIAATSHIPFTIEGTNAAWVALDNAATTALVIAIYADYYED